MRACSWHRMSLASAPVPITSCTMMVGLVLVMSVLVTGATSAPTVSSSGIRLYQTTSVTTTTDASHRRELEQLDGTDDSFRVRIRPFEVLLEYTPANMQLAASDLDEMILIIEQVLATEIQQSMEADEAIADLYPQNLTLKYVLMSNIDATFHSGEDDDTSTTTLALSAGVASFRGADSSPEPSYSKVNAWVQEAIDTRLITALQSSPYSYLETATYVDIDEPVVGGVQDGNYDTQKATVPVGLVAGTVVAAVAVLVAALLVLKRRRNNNSSHGGRPGRAKRVKSLPVVAADVAGDENTLNESYEQSPRKQGPPPSPRSASPPPTLRGAALVPAPPLPPPSPVPMNKRFVSLGEDTRSIADGSESDWTVNTEAGDSSALKSLSGLLLPGAHAAPYDVSTAVPQVVVPTESFERDRPLHLRKDMLTSTWSGRMPSHRPVQQESVLAPSHFTASQERHMQQYQAQQYAHGHLPSFHDPNGSDWEDSADDMLAPPSDVSSSVVGGGVPVVFENAHDNAGDEVFVTSEGASNSIVRRDIV